MSERPGVGIGVLILNNGRILLGKRRGSHGEGTWCLPGGHLEFGDSFEECASKEVREETGLDISGSRLISVGNDIMYGKHYVTLGMLVQGFSGEVKLMEPEKCEQWEWFEPDKLPAPLFEASKTIIENWKNRRVYNGV